MSASLVGSEMCIRDRSPRPLPPPCVAGLPFRALLRPAALSRRRRPAPVSYTHLTLPTICSV
eukprot:3657324-Alexandrium_andersonii.AAC.1